MARKSAEPRAPRPSGPFQNRIVGSGEMPASQFLANPGNWRIHSHLQERAITSSLSEVGWVQNVVVNRRTGHVLDGHLRIGAALSQGDDPMVPYVEVDLSPKEERLVLATLDPIGAMAGTDDDKLADLISDLPATGIDLDAVLGRAREATRGLTRDVKVNACTCCQTKCLPVCGCYRVENA